VRKAIDAHGESLSMDALAETTGTSKTVFYRYFGDRNGLTRAMADWATGVIRTSIDEAGQAEADPYRSLRSMIAALVAWACAPPASTASATPRSPRTPAAARSTRTWRRCSARAWA
jgi:AcrR family transcriptional regulator